MATGRENSDWHESGLIRRDFRQDHGSGPEIIARHPKRRNKRWCKGKEGREHNFQQALWYSYKYRDNSGIERERNVYRWVCQGCGKQSYGPPRPPVPKHEHCFCITETAERWRREEIWEKCCVCGGKGKAYSFYRQR